LPDLPGVMYDVPYVCLFGGLQRSDHTEHDWSVGSDWWPSERERVRESGGSFLRPQRISVRLSHSHKWPITLSGRWSESSSQRGQGHHGEREREVVISCPSSIRCIGPIFLVFSYFWLLTADPQQLRPSSDPSGADMSALVDRRCVMRQGEYYGIPGRRERERKKEKIGGSWVEGSRDVKVINLTG